MKKTYWFIFNQNGEIISKEYDSEEAAEKALNNGEYDVGEIPDYIDGLELEVEN